jgi:hypothetical protein
VTDSTIAQNPSAPNPHAELARERKAVRVVDVVAQIRPEPEPATIEHLSDHGWSALERIANVRPCSPQTRARVIAIYRHRRQVAATIRAAFEEADAANEARQAEAEADPIFGDFYRDETEAGSRIGPARVVVAGSPADQAWYDDFPGGDAA